MDMHLRDNPFFLNNQEAYKHAKIGDFTYGWPTLLFWSNRCSIGKFCALAEGSKIFGGGEHPISSPTSYPFAAIECFSPFLKNCPPLYTTKGPTTIMNDVWVGYNAIILSGVKIGNGAVIGAGSVVTKNIPDYAIAAGNPARVIRYRFSEEQITRLLDIAWWDLDISVICAAMKLLTSNNIDKFIAVMSKIKKDAGAKSLKN